MLLQLLTNVRGRVTTGSDSAFNAFRVKKSSEKLAKEGVKFCNTHITDGETQDIGNQGNYYRVNLAVNYTMPYYLITSGHQAKILKILSCTIH